jgi:hypothetical protein
VIGHINSRGGDIDDRYSSREDDDEYGGGTTVDVDVVVMVKVLLLSPLYGNERGPWIVQRNTYKCRRGQAATTLTSSGAFRLGAATIYILWLNGTIHLTGGAAGRHVYSTP